MAASPEFQLEVVAYGRLSIFKLHGRRELLAHSHIGSSIHKGVQEHHPFVNSDGW